MTGVDITGVCVADAAMAPLRLTGRPAARGFAEGPLHVVAQLSRARVASGDPATEQRDLEEAIHAAIADLTRLMADMATDAAEVLAFQVAMLEDTALIEPALDRIARGEPADTAFTAALEAEIAGYEASDDAYFAARAADLRDLRDAVLGHLSGTTSAGNVPPGAIVLAHDLPPSRFLAIDWRRGGALLLRQGSPTSHVAMLARSRGVPMIVGLGGDALGDGSVGVGHALVDAGAGEVLVNADAGARAVFRARSEQDRSAAEAADARRLAPAQMANGHPVSVLLNIAEPGELDGLDPAFCDGIGLVRTEFLFASGKAFPDEDAQYAIYRRMLEWAAPRPVTIRTLDAGGDKPIAGLTLEGESNPFLGVRGIRLSLRRPDVFRVQLRALLRAAVHGMLKVMLPMVTVPAELEQTRALMNAEMAALREAGVRAAMPPLGIMVEVPAAALAVASFDAAFFSIGSNDLTQYVTAAGRDIGAVADLADTRHPGVLRLLAMLAEHGQVTEREVSLCGDAGGDPAVIPSLLEAGLRTLSMAPALVGRAKLAIAAFDPTAGTQA